MSTEPTELTGNRFSGARVEKTYDIFRIDPEGPIWVRAVHGLAEAKQHVSQLRAKSPREYRIFDPEKSAFLDLDIAASA